MRLIESISENDWPVAFVVVAMVVGSVVVLVYLLESWKKAVSKRRDANDRLGSLESRVGRLWDNHPKVTKQLHDLEEAEMRRRGVETTQRIEHGD